MHHAIIRILICVSFLSCFLVGPQAKALPALGPILGRLLARTAVETGTSLAVTETYDQLKKAILSLVGSGNGTSANDLGISEISIDLLSYSDSRLKRVASIRQYETLSVVPNPTTGGLSYFRLLNVGYTNAGLPQTSSSSQAPFEFVLRDLSESCSNAEIGVEYRRLVNTKLLARHSYSKIPAVKPAGYILALGLGHAPVPSEAPCDTGANPPPAGIASLLFSIAPNGATVLSLPNSIQPNAVTSLWIAAAFALPPMRPAI